MSDTRQGEDWWQASDGRWYQPAGTAPAPPPPPAVAAAEQLGNGMAVAGLVLGIVSAVFGVIPLFFFIALPAGILGVIFGVVGRRRARRDPRRPGKGMATAGVVCGLLGISLGVVGIVILNDVFEDTEDEHERIGDELERDLRDVEE